MAVCLTYSQNSSRGRVCGCREGGGESRLCGQIPIVGSRGKQSVAWGGGNRGGEKASDFRSVLETELDFLTD